MVNDKTPFVTLIAPLNESLLVPLSVRVPPVASILRCCLRVDQHHLILLQAVDDLSLAVRDDPDLNIVYRLSQPILFPS